MLLAQNLPATSQGDELTVTLVAAGEALEIGDAEWSSLAKASSEPNAFFEPWFLRPAIAHLHDGQAPRLALARDGDGRLVGLLPLTIQPRYGRIPARHVGNWAHYQCFMGTPLVASGQETAFWHALIDTLDVCDWAEGFLSISGLQADGPAHRGLIAAAEAQARPAPIVHEYSRAVLCSALSPEAYLDAAVRGKKRKEYRRLSNRLSEQGTVKHRTLVNAADLSAWCEEFLHLEAAGWKGEGGAALGNTAQTKAFFSEMMAGALHAGRLDFKRMDLDGRAIAMLINFLTPPGSWSFKIAYDETLARFSPGVLIELENLRHVLENPSLEWMDSCAIENHPMIDRLWMERRRIIQVSVPLSGKARRLVYNTCRAAETGSAKLRQLLNRDKW